jgi:hypothetical protein
LCRRIGGIFASLTGVFLLTALGCDVGHVADGSSLAPLLHHDCGTAPNETVSAPIA